MKSYTTVFIGLVLAIAAVKAAPVTEGSNLGSPEDGMFPKGGWMPTLIEEEEDSRPKANGIPIGAPRTQTKDGAPWDGISKGLLYRPPQDGFPQDPSPNPGFVEDDLYLKGGWHPTIGAEETSKPKVVTLL
ncbi:hypothetical protein BGZ49_005251 [Haplosporangium sp. Z 27]|nr:hypothetical protein BGZ49_005251 [Haplosporangium sp. Z 27]